MNRIFFRRPAPGEGTLRGHLIEELQLHLAREGFDPTGGIDGKFGKYTEGAIISFQESRSLPRHGAVDATTWRILTGTGAPSLFDRCLQMTACFEGFGFRKTVGNYNGAGLTWGIIGFTLRQGEIQRLLKQIDTELLERCFKNHYNELMDILAEPLEKQLYWAAKISTGTTNYGVAPEWRAAFDLLGEHAQVQQLQVARAKEVYWNLAEGQAEAFGLRNELGVAMMFDIARQNGGLSRTVKREYEFEIHDRQILNETDKLKVIAEVVSEGTHPRWRQSILKRKLTFATGRGEVYGNYYNLEDWGLGAYPM